MDLKRISRPFGDQSALPPPLSSQGVSWRRFEPFASTTKSARPWAGSPVGPLSTSKTSCFPSGDQAGRWFSAVNGLLAVTWVSWRMPLPSAFMTKISANSLCSSWKAPQWWKNAINFPFGDHAGSPHSLQVPSRFSPVPSPLIVHTWQLFWQRSNATFEPSGDQSGFMSSRCGPFVVVSLRRPVPSALTTHRRCGGELWYTIFPFLPGFVACASATTAPATTATSASVVAVLTRLMTFSFRQLLSAAGGRWSPGAPRARLRPQLRDPEGRHHSLAGDSQSLACALHGPRRGRVEQTEDEVIAREADRPQVGDSRPFRPNVRVRPLGDMLELVLLDLGPEALRCVDHRGGNVARPRLTSVSIVSQRVADAAPVLETALDARCRAAGSSFGSSVPWTSE